MSARGRIWTFTSERPDSPQGLTQEPRLKKISRRTLPGAVLSVATGVLCLWSAAIAETLDDVALRQTAAALFGLVVERVAVRPFFRAGSPVWLLSAIAFGIIVENVAMVAFGKDARAFPSGLALKPVFLLGAGVYPQELLLPVVGLALTVVFVALTVRGGSGWRDLGRRARDFVESFALMTTDLTLLLATLSIMTGVFVITGVPTKLGFVLMEAAGIHLVVMLLVAFAFGTLIGTGLPPAPTYIITALVIAPFLIKAGIDAWVVRFYAFFIAVWGELTPPTSVAAAVTAKIAEAPFLQTLFKAIQICVCLFVLMAGVFTRPELVLEPGVAQIGAMLLLLTATIGVSFSIQAQFSANRGLDLMLRVVLAAFTMLVLLHPDRQVAVLSCLPVGLFVGYWVLRRRKAPVVAGAAAG